MAYGVAMTVYRSSDTAAVCPRSTRRSAAAGPVRPDAQAPADRALLCVRVGLAGSSEVTAGGSPGF